MHISPTCPWEHVRACNKFCFLSDMVLPACTAALWFCWLASALERDTQQPRLSTKGVCRRQLQAPLTGNTVSYTEKKTNNPATKALEPPHVRASPGLHLHLGAILPSNPSTTHLQPAATESIACYLQETNAFHSLPALLSGKLAQHRQQMVKRMLVPQGIALRVVWVFLRSMLFPKCLILGF